MGIGDSACASAFPHWPRRRAIADGARVTVWLTLIAGSAGVLLGVLAGIGKLSKFLPIRLLCDFYVWIIRGTPLLLQIMFVWLALPSIMPEGVDLSDFACAAIALSLNVGAYNTECVRAGILAVPHGQVEAAKALGLKPLQTFMDVILPQSMRVALPALANNLAIAQFAGRNDRLTQKSDTLDRQISTASNLKSMILSLASSLGDRVRVGDLSPQPSIANSAVAKATLSGH